MTDTTTKPQRTTLQMVRMIVWALAALAAVVFAVLLLRPSSPQPQVQSSLPGFTLGGPFTLTGADGKPFSSTQLAGKPYAIFFGFTHCPDVCPNTLARLAQLRQSLGEGDDAFRIVFVTVDPERDTPEAVGAYAKLFDTPIVGLTGTRPQIDQVAKQHAVYQARSPQADGYTMDHGASVLLFDRDGKFVSTIAQEEGNDVALEKLRRITA